MQINEYLKEGENLLTVAVDNRIDHTTLPVGSEAGGGMGDLMGMGGGKTSRKRNNPNFDFFNYCGITRPVKLYTTPASYIQDIFLNAEVENTTARITYHLETVGEATAKIAVYTKDGRLAAEAEGTDGTLEISDVILWQPLCAYLYDVRVTYGEDVYTLPYGVRTVKTEGGKFLINGRPFYFKGYGKHEDTFPAGRGLNLPMNTKDISLMKWQGANSFRTSHYPYSEEMMRLCDEEGIVVIDETPAVGVHLNFGGGANFKDGKRVNTFDPPEEGGIRTHSHHMDVVRDMAFHPTLDPQELESEKNVIVAELQRGEDDPGSRMFKTLLADTLKGTPYDRPIIGYEKTIRALTTQNLRDYIAKYYQPQNMLLVVVGNVDPAEVLAEAEKMFAPYKNTTPLKEVMPYEADRLPLPGSKPALVVQPGPWNKVYLAAALPVPGSSSYQSATLDVLAYLLGGDRTSLFYKTYKYERQLVDSISVSNVGFERIGAFVVTAELDADKVEPFWTSLTKDFAALDASTFTPEQLERAKLNLEDDLYRSKETLSGLASKIGYFQFFMGGDQGERNAIEALRNVDNGMLKQVLAAWVQPDRLTTVVLPPKDAKMPDMQAILDKEWKSGAKASAAKTAEAGKTEVIDLGKGRTVVLIPDKTLPYVSANLTYSGGDALLKPSEQGLSALVSNVLTKGTAKRSATEMQAFLADRAAGLAASAGRKTFSVNLTTPARFNKNLFDLLGEVVTAPAFSKDETARGIKDQLAAIKSREDQPLGLAFRKLPPFLFPGSVYGYLQLGEPENVQKYDEAQLRSFWSRQKARPWVLAVSGDFDRDQILAFAKSLPAPEQRKVDVPVPAWGTRPELDIPMPGRNQAHLMLIFKTAPDTSPDTPALDLLETSLGGMGGPLFRDLRDKQGLGYTVTAFNRQTSENGYMVFYIGTEPGKMAQAEEGFKRIINDLHQNLLSEEDVNRGKNQLEGDYYRNMQSLGSRSGEAAALTMEGYPLSFTKDQIEKSKNVTPEQLREIVKKYLNVDSAYTIKVLP